MTLQASGAISLANVQTEFGGSNPISISEYYAAAAGVPGSGTISLYNFYGKSAPAAPAFGGWSYLLLGISDVTDNVNNTNTFISNTVTPGNGTQYTISISSSGVGSSSSVRFYVGGSLNTTFTSSTVFTPTPGNSSIRFESTLQDTDPYYEGGQGHYPSYGVIYAASAPQNLNYTVFYHTFDYANVGDPDYDD